MTDRPDLVFAFHRLTWDRSTARAGYFAQDRLAQGVVRSDRFRRVLVADGYQNVIGAAMHRARPQGRPFPAQGGAALTSPLRLTRSDADSPAALRRAYGHYSRWVRRAAARNGMGRPHLLTTHPLYAAFGEHGWAATVTYYATDEFAVGDGRVSRRYAAAREVIADRVDVKVAAVSHEILERMGGTGKRLEVANGIDPEEWATPPVAPAWFDRLPRPRLLYTGGLNRRLDASAIAAASGAVGGGSVVLVGRTLHAEHIEELSRIPNVHVHPQVDRATLTGLVAAADVGLVPHVVDTMTRSMSPLKAYEYLAAGLPVVSTRLPVMERLGPRVLCVEPEEFGAAVDQALVMGPASAGERQSFLRASSWEERHRRLFDFVCEGA